MPEGVMTTSPPRVNGRRPVVAPPSPEVLLQQLVAACLPSGRDTGAGSQVLLDAEIGGNRYLLVRRPRPADEPALLSPREHEIARLVSCGHVNKTIARVLEISVFTVDTYIRRLFAKLNVTTRAAMVAKLAEMDGFKSAVHG
jgi:DNA-binding NarL/FixJ family response regulator